MKTILSRIKRLAEKIALIFTAQNSALQKIDSRLAELEKKVDEYLAGMEGEQGRDNHHHFFQPRRLQ